VGLPQVCLGRRINSDCLVALWCCLVVGLVGGEGVAVELVLAHVEVGGAHLGVRLADVEVGLPNQVANELLLRARPLLIVTYYNKHRIVINKY
jgi:hypothetical protein